MSFFYIFSLLIFLFLCVVLSLVILMQESKSTGLGASFGGGDTSDSLFGVSTPEILKKVTAWLAIVFMSGCLILSNWTSAKSRIKAPSYLMEEAKKSK